MVERAVHCRPSNDSITRGAIAFVALASNETSMMNRFRASSQAKGIFALLLLCALAVRVAIPTGFMPTWGANGVIISLCTGQGVVKMMLPLEEDSEHSEHQGGADAPCVYAAGLGSSLTGDAFVTEIEAAQSIAKVRATRAIADLTVHRLANPPPPAHAPPRHA